MKKKIGIITLCGYHNYGNRLQNYALQSVLEKLGFSVLTIKNITIQQKSSLFERVYRNRGNFLNLVYAKYHNRKNKKLHNERTQRFFEFSKKYIEETDYTISELSIPDDLSEKFDFFVTGSDQVWNPELNRGSSVEFLQFAPSEKRISYAASFGVSKIPEHVKTDFKERLNQMAHISVREEAGARIVKELTGRDAEVLIDPTMLLDKEEWISIAKAPAFKPKKNYLLTYFLGDGSKEYKQWINHISKTFDLEVINLLDPDAKDAYLTDPGEFIDLINNAALMCTDSFHGSVFSILMHTDFMVFDRIEKNEATMGSRIDTLLNMFELTSRKWHKDIKDDDVFNTSFTHVDEILNVERQKAMKYLKNALHLESGK